ncbi:MAG: UDP-N-acetylmuramoyl-tripeptide--D-alanyl-D-alanine ligase [Desulfatitalea sp.]|nr:UDP-N-acetylmuramoyl-tripeptide--D-alanyl-D-alanine ligase [Desulfatitalea sp.]NNK01092.1 UDP-N-acetylmuramoyl-tripeptide--D-alanyl-D-alanine ligase [Desulfatitalea sp.]
MQWTIDDIVKATNGRLCYGAQGARFNGVGIDSRTIDGDHLFVAICGETHDGHSFIGQVVGRGVKGLVVRRAPSVPLNHDRWRDMGAACIEVENTTGALGGLARYQRDRCDIPVVAITGSNGKTTTRQMTAAVIAQKYTVLSTHGNLNNEIGLPLTLFRLTADHEAAVLELGMNHPGEMTRLGHICRPTLGMITNVAPAHLEFLGSLEGVTRAKGELISQVDPAGAIVLNLDDPHVAALARACDHRILFFGMGEGAQVRARDIVPHKDGIGFELVTPDGRVPVTLPTHGCFMVANALAAAAAGHLLGLSPECIKTGLETFTPEKGRLHVRPAPGGVHMIDDTYNANPASMTAALETLTALRGKAAAIVALGDMLELGEQSAALHRQIGRQAAAANISRLYAHGQFAEDVCQGARSAGMPADTLFAGEKAAIAADIIRYLAPGTWVMVKGSRGMAMESVVQAIMER